MYTLYSMRRSGNCYKVRLVLAQLGIAHELVEVLRARRNFFKPQQGYFRDDIGHDEGNSKVQRGLLSAKLEGSIATIASARWWSGWGWRRAISPAAPARPARPSRVSSPAPSATR